MEGGGGGVGDHEMVQEYEALSVGVADRVGLVLHDPVRASVTDRVSSTDAVGGLAVGVGVCVTVGITIVGVRV